MCERRTREQAVATLQSPQFRRTLDVFSAALVSGRLDLRHFGLDPQVGFSSSCGRIQSRQAVTRAYDVA